MCNAGLFDRIFRGVLGFALIVSALYGFDWGWIGLVPNYRDWETDRKSTRLNSSHITRSRMPSSA